LLEHIVYKEGVLVDPTKVFFIVNVKYFRTTLGYIHYYRCFIHNYVSITTPLKKLSKKFDLFLWTLECEDLFKLLKEKMIGFLILLYPNWKVEFYVHVDASNIALGVVLLHPREGNLDHPIYFTSMKLSQDECNYNIT
jgi:hypothetical protein